MKNSVTNTTQLGASALLLRAMSATRPGGDIEEMEARGQKELCESLVLPVDCDQALRQQLEAFGVKFGGPVHGDPLFVHVELPTGWRIVPTDHSMWSDLRDEGGRVVANVFYKAAHYDRRAMLRRAR